MKTKLLVTFEMVARLRSFSAAAKALNTVQPAVSRQILDLENHLKVKLFWRTTREVKLTPAGEVLLDDVTKILASHKKAEARVQLAAKGQVGTLRIGYLESASYKFLPQLIRQYSELYPEVQVSLDIMTAREQVESFKDGRIDVGISRPLLMSENLNLTSQFIYNDSLMAFLPLDHSFAGQKSISLNDIKSDNFIIFKRKEAKSLYDAVIAMCTTAKFSPTITHEPSTMQTVLTLVASGLGVSIAPGCIRQLYADGCRCLPLLEKSGPITLEIHYDAVQEKKTVSNFAKLINENLQDIQASMAMAMPIHI